MRIIPFAPGLVWLVSLLLALLLFPLLAVAPAEAHATDDAVAPAPSPLYAFVDVQAQAAAAGLQLDRPTAALSTSQAPPDRRHRRGRSKRSSSEITSITIGYLDDDFRYVDRDRTLLDDEGASLYRNTSALSAVMFSAQHTSLLLGYGVQNSLPEREQPALRTLYVAAEAGENLSLVDDVMHFPLQVYVPVRLLLGYRATTGRPDTHTEDLATLHLANAQAAAGIGGQFTFPGGLPVVGDNLVGFASVVRGLGGVGDLRRSLDGARLARSLDVNLEVQVRRIFGGQAGLTIGYTYRTLSWSDQGVRSVFDFLDVLVGAADGFERNSVQSLFRVGINF
jgi:hypothetical protein